MDTKLLFISIQMLFFIELNFGVYFFFFWFNLFILLMFYWKNINRRTNWWILSFLFCKFNWIWKNLKIKKYLLLIKTKLPIILNAICRLNYNFNWVQTFLLDFSTLVVSYCAILHSLSRILEILNHLFLFLFVKIINLLVMATPKLSLKNLFHKYNDKANVHIQKKELNK